MCHEHSSCYPARHDTVTKTMDELQDLRTWRSI